MTVYENKKKKKGLGHGKHHLNQNTNSVDGGKWFNPYTHTLTNKCTDV